MMDESVAAEAIVPLKFEKPLQQLNRIAKRPTLDIEFEDLEFAVRDTHAKGGWRRILHSVSGAFRCGELTAIMGPSGAGKSTLLNILAGYVTTGVKGLININNKPRELKIFNKLSSYIMQEDQIQPRLTVREAMTYAAVLKLGSHITLKQKEAVVTEVITLLGLEKCANTRSEYLSGGQRKRLMIALELVNNPPVIFLDEPTTGLDNFAIKQCIDLLKKISQIDRTVICTIHQPPSSLFQFFDQVYIVANGSCVYNGSPTQLVSFFSYAGYACPPNNTPADYMIELVHSQPNIVSTFAASTQNGKLNMRETITSKDQIEEIDGEDLAVYRSTTHAISKCDINFATPFRVQFITILSRMFTQMVRNKTALYIQLFHHILSGLIVGGIFYGIGNDASQTNAIFKYCVCCNVFFMYTYVMTPVLLFPLEVTLLKREYFNRWYSLKAYYAALTVATLPMLLVLSCIFSAIVYFMTYQPLETHRFIGFEVMGLAMALTSQGLGYFIGSMFSITNGSIIGPSVLAPLLAIAVYGMGYKATIEPFYKFLMTLTYLRNGLVGYCNTLFYQREPLVCPESELYCHYGHAEVLMSDMALPVAPYEYQLGWIFMFMVLFRIAAYLALKARLNKELSSKVVYYVNKVVKHKY